MEANELHNETDFEDDIDWLFGVDLGYLDEELDIRNIHNMKYTMHHDRNPGYIPYLRFIYSKIDGPNKRRRKEFEIKKTSLNKMERPCDFVKPNADYEVITIDDGNDGKVNKKIDSFEEELDDFVKPFSLRHLLSAFRVEKLYKTI